MNPPYIVNGDILVTNSHIDEHFPDLNIAQLNAIDLITAGLRDKEVAELVGVARETVTRWRLYNPKFQAELFRRRHEVWSSCTDKIRCIFLEALNSLDSTLKYGGVTKHSGLVLDVIKLFIQHSDILSDVGSDAQEGVIIEISSEKT